jgi:hypothetical protein
LIQITIIITIEIIFALANLIIIRSSET